MPSLLQRLKERKIVQWAIVYLAGAWLFLEALGFVADNFGWPTYITRSAIVLAAVGFFAALVLAWYHGEKGRQRASGVELLILAGSTSSSDRTKSFITMAPVSTGSTRMEPSAASFGTPVAPTASRFPPTGPGCTWARIGSMRWGAKPSCAMSCLPTEE